MGTAISIEGLGKQYRLGTVSTGTLSHDLNRWWARMRGKEDPFLKLGEANNRTQKGSSDLVWALRDVSYEVKQGEVLGIVGRNGAGKSTLLKILSRTTTPTTGSFKVKGRIASLLEVGTGFHPELTGRENIFLNGAILGMSKAEIRRSFDEILAFSGVERYVETPVKRYSSGMYVRLAFAVAAHLEPEILIVDEVLAVGDAEFQRKCIGKMKEVSGQGRTVLFVSHNMSAIESLCTTGLLMRNGRVQAQGNVDEVLSVYLDEKSQSTDLEANAEKRGGNGKARMCSIAAFNSAGARTDMFRAGDELCVKIRIAHREKPGELNVVLSIYNEKEVLVANISNVYSGDTLNPSAEEIEMRVPVPFRNGNYSCNAVIFGGAMVSPEVYDKVENYYLFTIDGGDLYGTGQQPNSGIIILDPQWK